MSQTTQSSVAVNDPRNPHQMPLHRKLTYSFTDLSGNLLYCIISTYALYYFTEVYGLSMAIAGTILLVARFFDAFDAPVWGVIIDHTHTRWGQSRPWFLWMAVPFSLFVFLLFCAPPIGDTTARAWYAGVVYVLAGISYTGMSAPITSVLPNLTSNPDERNVASTFRMVGGNVGNFLAVTFILPLATKFGGSSTSPNGWRIAVGLYCLVALVLLVVAFLDMREQNIERTKPISIKQSFKAAKGNWPWVLVVVANVVFWIGFTSRTSMLPYYFRYNVGNESWTSILNGISIIQVLGMMSVPFLCKRLHLWGTTVLALGFAAVGQAGLALTGGFMPAMVVSWCVACLGSGTLCSLFVLMVTYSVDFGEWKNGIRAAGLLTAIGSSFCIKMGSGIGAFLPSQILSACGFVNGSKTQSALALSAIHFSFTWLPMIIFLLCMIPVYLYKRYEDQQDKVLGELKARDAQH
ncbi:MFS transporter [uncultured Bifidobacterium sp.]|uniref:MFS transporter n=1 Tax=uncultured Bifidobacterium sp. TaxID=165187 RepID=UPI000EDB436D|nr:glycoside-pentoside-hexuronide (GPH):cation symporter [uncultured Bifidobacterium sp.]HAK71527.1 MFS transporter [Bifidobacterium sp.]